MKEQQRQMAATTDIHVFYVNFFDPAPGNTGEAFPPSYFSGSANARFTNNLVLSATLKGFSTLPHEIGHILLNDASHEADSKNLMYGTVDNVNRLLAKKRFQLDQETKIHNPLNPTFAIEGEHDGFPAYEIYINTKHPIFLHTDVLQWSPPLSADVFELVSNFDVSVSSVGNINQ